jgi:RNA polymerase sigma-70 factor (ECF subfamily)
MIPVPPAADATEEEPADSGLARRWQAGDRAAGSALIDRHLPRLRAFFAVRCASATEAEDLAQEVFLAVCRHLEAFDPALPFTGWLYGIARNKLADFWRRQHPIATFERVPPEAVDHRSPADIHQESDGAADAWKEVFARLPEAQATALWLRVQEDLSVQEIARTMEVSLANAKVLLFRARQTLLPIFKQRVHAT